MNIVDKLYEEWAWRSESGVPSLENPKDKLVLEQLYKEYGIPLIEGAVIASKISEKNLNILTKLFKSIKEDYSKYLSIFNYFAPKSLDTVSEVLLAKLVEKEGKGIVTLESPDSTSNLKVNGEDVVLRTSSDKEVVELGGDSIRTTQEEVNKLVDNLLPLFTENPNLESFTVGKLVHEVPSSKFNIIDNELKTLARRLTGKEGKESFVWLEKQYSDDQLKYIIIHTVRYNYEDVLREFLTSNLRVYSKGWRLVKNGIQVAVSDKSKTQVLLHPDLVKTTTEDTPITIKINTLDENQGTVKERISDRFLKSLDKIYDDIFDKVD